MSNIQKFPEGLEGTTPNFWIYLEFVCLETYTESAQTWGFFPHLDECYNPIKERKMKEPGKGRGGKGYPDTDHLFWWFFLFSETGYFEKYRQKVIYEGFWFEAIIQK